jgi:hypothetical protein
MRSRLRLAVIAFFALFLVSGGTIVALVATRSIVPQWILPAIWMLVIGTILGLGTLFEKTRYKTILPAPPPGWQQTGERFVDHQSGQTVDVYANPETGERAYVSCL